jgi:drug/metabolite transporter (DMT)-like permease
MQTETPLTALFYFLLFSTLASAGPAFYQVSDLSFLIDWPYLLLIGLFFSLCQMLRSQALIYIDANVLGCYSYLTPVFSLILGVTFLEESFTCYRLLGSALILASGMSIYYEKRVRKNRPLA